MRAASLEIIDGSGALTDAQRSLMRETLAAALDETGRFRIRPDAPGASPADCLFAAKVSRADSPASGQPSWEVSLDLLEAASRRVLQSYDFHVSGPAELWLSGVFLKELAYRYAPLDTYPELAKKAGLVGKVEHPKLQSRDPRLLASLLMTELENAQWDKALSRCEPLLDVQPGNELALHARALALHRLGRLEEALEAVERHPGGGTCAVNLTLKADILCDAARYDAALECYEEALEADPQFKDPALKLKALTYFLKAPPDGNLLFPRAGWCVNFLALAPLVGGPNERNKAGIAAAFEDLDHVFAELVGETLSFYLKADIISAWNNAVRRGDAKAFDLVCSPVVKGILGGAGSHFPSRGFRWLKWGYDLNWLQFGLGKHLQDMRDGETPQASDVSRTFSELAAQMREDPLFLERCPSMGPVVERFSRAGAGTPSVEKLETACRGIDDFCEIMFG